MRLTGRSEGGKLYYWHVQHRSESMSTISRLIDRFELTRTNFFIRNIHGQFSREAQVACAETPAAEEVKWMHWAQLSIDGDLRLRDMHKKSLSRSRSVVLSFSLLFITSCHAFHSLVWQFTTKRVISSQTSVWRGGRFNEQTNKSFNPFARTRLPMMSQQEGEEKRQKC